MTWIKKQASSGIYIIDSLLQDLGNTKFSKLLVEHIITRCSWKNRLKHKRSIQIEATDD